MATQPKKNPMTDSVEAAAERASEFQTNALASSKKTSEAYLSSYEKAVVTLADTYEKAAQDTKIDWIADLGSKQADTTRQIARSYVGAVRDFAS